MSEKNRIKLFIFLVFESFFSSFITKIKICEATREILLSAWESILRSIVWIWIEKLHYFYVEMDTEECCLICQFIFKPHFPLHLLALIFRKFLFILSLKVLKKLKQKKFWIIFPSLFFTFVFNNPGDFSSSYVCVWLLFFYTITLFNNNNNFFFFLYRRAFFSKIFQFIAFII